MKRLVKPVVVVVLLALSCPVLAVEWYASTSGKADGQGTKDAPWDLASALEGKHKIAPADTLWILGGTYKFPDRRLGSPGYQVRLAGQEGKPIQVRGVPGVRVTIDGGLSVVAPSTYLWVRDLEILVSENLSMPRTVKQTGSHPDDYGRPWGGLTVHAGKDCKYINLVIHDNAQGISLWSGATDTEVYGCLIYDNGWKAADRGHGHAIYTQNKDGIKTISDCIMTGGYGYTVHAYGSSNAYVDNYVCERNICYDAGPFLIGGGRPSHNIRVLGNLLYRVPMQIGYGAANEDCEVRDNLIVDAGLTISKYKKVVNEGNQILGPKDPRPSEARVVIYPNRYDANRANIAVFKWEKKPSVALPLDAFLKPGDQYRLLAPKDFYGKPILEGRFDGKPVRLPMAGEFTAMVLIREPVSR